MRHVPVVFGPGGRHLRPSADVIHTRYAPLRDMHVCILEQHVLACVHAALRARLELKVLVLLGRLPELPIASIVQLHVQPRGVESAALLLEQCRCHLVLLRRGRKEPQPVGHVFLGIVESGRVLEEHSSQQVGIAQLLRVVADPHGLGVVERRVV